MKTVLTLLALVVLVAVPVAQTTVTAIPVEGPPTYGGTYHLPTGEITPTPPPPLDVVVFDNTTSNGSFFPAGPGFINMDWGTLSAGGANDITAMQIGYASGQVTPIDLNVNLHEGALGFGDPGTTITGFSLSGLPDTGGGPAPVVVDVTGLSLTLPDGPIGWSYESLDVAGPGGTGPLTIGPPNETDVIDAFDQYDSGFGYIGTFNFGAGAPLASFHMQLTATTECFLVIGDEVGGGAMFDPGLHQFNTMVGQVEDFYPVLMDNTPDFEIPVFRRLVGSGMAGPMGPAGPVPEYEHDWMADGEFAVQVVMWNPGVFPSEPEQVTHGLYVRIMPDGSVVTRPFGQGTGMTVWAETDTDDEGNPVVRFPFFIPGL